MAEFKHLFTPIRLGNVEIPNRIMMSPHGMTGLRPGTQEQLDYYEARAKGGAGFVGIACCPCQEIHVYKGMFMTSRDEENIPKLARIGEVVHKHGSKVFAHVPWMNGAPDVPQPSKYVPSTMWGNNESREMTRTEIEELIYDHAKSAENLVAAGIDGMECPVAGGAGLQYFVSPLYNKRTDDYGGDLEGRMKIIFDIAREVKRLAGPDFILGFKINPDETLLGGPDLQTGLAIAEMMGACDDIDWIRVAARGQKPQLTQFHYPPSYMPQGVSNYASAAIREVVDNKPIITGGRMTSAEFMEQSLAEGQCDMVFAARAFIVDPEWPNKARRGDTEDIRHCLGDTEGCFLRSCYSQAPGCTYNVDIGFEGKDVYKEAEIKKTVAIIGAGPAGLQCALTAAKRGHDIILVEREEHVGGHVHMEGQLPGLTDRQSLPLWYEHELRKFPNVDIRLGVNADADYVKSLGADVTIIATGAEYSRMGISYLQMMAVEGWDTEEGIYTPEDIIYGDVDLGDKVVVFDGTGYQVGPGVAEMIASQGKEVVIATVDPLIANGVWLLGEHQVTSLRLKALDVEHIANVAPLSVKDGVVTFKNVVTYDTVTVEDVDSVVMVAAKPPRDELYHALVEEIEDLRIIGDAADSHWSYFGTDDATKAGHKAGLAI